MSAHLEAMARYRDAVGMTPLLERAQPARITVEPIAEGEDLGDMVRCSGCRRAAVPDERRRMGGPTCSAYIPHQAALLRRCHRYQPKGAR